MFKKIPVCALVFLFTMLSAQHAVVKHITVNEGLSQNYIYSIHQDTKGFLWFGTKDGLNRYDGYSFKIYRKDNSDTLSLADNTVTAIADADSHSLWIGTALAGLSYFDKVKESFLRLQHLIPAASSFSRSRIHVVRLLNNGSILICTSDNGVAVADPNKRSFKIYKNEDNAPPIFSSNNITDAEVDHDGNLWVVSDGLVVISPEGTVTRVQRKGGNSYNESLNKISFLYCDKLGRMWVGHRLGIDVYVGMQCRRVITTTPENNLYWFSAMRQDSYGNIWATTAHYLVKIDPHSFEYTVVGSFPVERLTSGLYIDKSDNVWMGTAGWGILQYNPYTEKFGRAEGNFLSEIFSRELGLLRSYSKQHRFSFPLDLTLHGNEFRLPFRDVNGDVYVPTSDAVFYRIDVHNRVKEYSLVPKETSDRKAYSSNLIFKDSNHTVWINRNNGLIKFINREKLYNLLPLYSDSGIVKNTSGYADITCAYVSNDGIIWFGTPTLGLLEFNPTTKEEIWYRYREYDTTSLSHNHVLSILEDPNEPTRYLWIGTDGGGLNKFDRQTKTFTSITEKQGFPNNTVYGILADETNMLWISTNKGLVKFNPKNYSMHLFDMYDGLQSNEFNRREYYKTADGKMYFGGVNGFNAFYPKDISINNTPPEVVFTDFRLFNKPVSFKGNKSILQKPIEFTDTLVLKHDDNVLTFEFAALEYSSPEKNQYQYKLDGFDDHWIKNGTSRTAVYTNIDPGTYTLKVKASNGDGVWSTKEASIILTILPPFWMTWWFRGILIFIFLLSGPSIYYFRVTQLKREQQHQHEISQMLIESQELERKRIAQEMHDSLGQELLVIKNRAVMGLKTAVEESKEKRQLEQISEGATNILKLVRSLSHNLRPPELDRLGLTETIRSILTNVREASAITLHAELDNIDGMIKKEDEINVIRILQEALSNIEKHSDATEIFIFLKIEQEQINLSIQDNGKGFVVDAVKHGIGLAGISERVRILHGSLSIASAIGNGTTLTFTIPIFKTNV